MGTYKWVVSTQGPARHRVKTNGRVAGWYTTSYIRSGSGGWMTHQ